MPAPEIGRLEARVARDHVIRELPAVAPPAHGEPLRIGDAMRHQVVHAREHVLDVLLAPVRVDRLRPLEAATGAAARIHADDRESVRREHLP